VCSARLADAGLPLIGLFTVPNSVQAITPLVGQIQIESEAHRAKGEYACLYVFHNRPQSGALYEPVSQRLLPLDAPWATRPGQSPWPTKTLPEVMGKGTTTARTHPRIPFHLALPGLRRLPREREREPLGGDGTRRQEHRRICWRIFNRTFHRLRQSGIDEELFDVISGFDRNSIIRQ
jgi:F-type H+-transporting ATPase subunit gamma